MTYNLTFIDNSSGPLVLIQGINDNAGNWYIGSLLIFLFFILFVAFKRSGSQDAFLASSFIISLLSGLAFGFGVLNGIHLVFPISILVTSLIMKVWGDG